MVVFIAGIPVLALGSLWEHPSEPERGQVPAAPQQVPILEGTGEKGCLDDLCPCVTPAVYSGDMRRGSGAGG